MRYVAEITLILQYLHPLMSKERSKIKEEDKIRMDFRGELQKSY